MTENYQKISLIFYYKIKNNYIEVENLQKRNGIIRQMCKGVNLKDMGIKEVGD